MMRTTLKILGVTALLLTTAAPGGAGGGDVQDLAWGQLVPPAAVAENLKAKGFLGGAKKPGESRPGSGNPFGGGGGADAVPPPQANDAPWMSMRSQQPGAEAPPAVVAELHGKRVRIGGYVVPLDFDATKVTEFLLVPFVGACIHVPPPPPNQVIYVKSAEGFEVQGQFDPVYVTGTIKTARQVTGLAATGYTMEAERVDERKQ
jgi:hypothetical protein